MQCGAWATWLHTHVNMLVQDPGRGRQERPRRCAHGHVSVLAPFEPQLPETPSLTIPDLLCSSPTFPPQAGPQQRYPWKGWPRHSHSYLQPEVIWLPKVQALNLECMLQFCTEFVIKNKGSPEFQGNLITIILYSWHGIHDTVIIKDKTDKEELVDRHDFL